MSIKLLQLLDANSQSEWWLKAIFWCITILYPIAGIVSVIYILIIIDFIIGVWAATNSNSFHPAKMWNTVRKLFLYQLVILAGFLIETYIIDGIIPLNKIVSGFIAMIELKSIFYNFNKIFGIDLWKEVKEWTRNRK